MIRNEKGITMVSLAITIAVMMILTFTFTVNVNLYTERKKQTNFETDMLRLKEEIIQYYADNKALPIANRYTNTSYLEKNVNDNENYYVIDLSKIDVDLNYGKDFYNIEDNEQEINDLLNIYIINEQSFTIYFPKGIDYDGQTHYTTDDVSNIEIEDTQIYALKIEGETVAIIGEEIQLVAKTIPEFIENTTVIWSSSDEEKATVNENGLVTTLAVGQVTITATSTDNESITATHEIKIKNDKLSTRISNTNYGDLVNYSVEINNQTYNNWKIFYKENDEIFIICTDYIPANILPSSGEFNTVDTVIEEYPYTAYWFNAPSMQTINNSNLNLFKSKLYTLNENLNNSKCVSTLLNTANWTNFVNTTYADLAVGSPTIEMWCASWNANTEDTITPTATDELYGYKVNNLTAIQNLDKTNTLYFPELPLNSNCLGYRLASCGSIDMNKVMHIAYDGATGQINSENYNNCSYGIRPVVHLKSKISGEFTGGKWQLQ